MDCESCQRLEDKLEKYRVGLKRILDALDEFFVDVEAVIPPEHKQLWALTKKAATDALHE